MYVQEQCSVNVENARLYITTLSTSCPASVGQNVSTNIPVFFCYLNVGLQLGYFNITFTIWKSLRSSFCMSIIPGMQSVFLPCTLTVANFAKLAKFLSSSSGLVHCGCVRNSVQITSVCLHARHPPPTGCRGRRLMMVRAFVSDVRNSFHQFLPGSGGDADLSISPTTSNQLAHWFTPELLAQAQAQTRSGKANSTLNMVNVEELERLQQNSAPVLN